MTTERAELLALLTELGQEAPDLRLGQLVANLATLAQGAKVEAIWDAEDDELVTAAKRLLAHYRQRNADVAPMNVTPDRGGEPPRSNARPT